MNQVEASQYLTSPVGCKAMAFVWPIMHAFFVSNRDLVSDLVLPRLMQQPRFSKDINLCICVAVLQHAR